MESKKKKVFLSHKFDIFELIYSLLMEIFGKVGRKTIGKSFFKRSYSVRFGDVKY